MPGAIYFIGSGALDTTAPSPAVCHSKMLKSAVRRSIDFS
jgi:hypothetical protein